MTSLAPLISRESRGWELAAESITVKIRWFGLCVGYVLVNVLDRQGAHRPVLNGILTLGALYALLDTIWSWRGLVLLGRWPLLISLMEAVFIGLLCHFDQGLESPFRFYYFLSLLVCAMRYSPQATWATLGLHALSVGALALLDLPQPRTGLPVGVLLVSLGWVTWASTSLAGLIKSTSQQLAQLNEALRQNQQLLEQRISERTRELQESQALVVQQEKQAAFGLLAAGIAHEVGNPLTAISSLVQLLNRHPHDDYTRDRLQMVDDQLHRIQVTLRELVDFSRPTTLDRSLCDLRDIIGAAVNIAKYYKRIKGKRVLTDCSPDLPAVRVARDPLVQVILNLVLNAMDATVEGGTISLAATQAGEWIQVTVRDDGHGISPEHQHRVFQPYFTTKDTGTGLGLFVCRRIMEHTLQGRIELSESSPRGTAFLVSIPANDEASGERELPVFSRLDAQRR